MTAKCDRITYAMDDWFAEDKAKAEQQPEEDNAEACRQAGAESAEVRRDGATTNEADYIVLRYVWCDGIEVGTFGRGML